MALTLTNLIAGISTLGADLTPSTTPASNTYVDVGGTQGGIKLEHDAETNDIEVDQSIFAVERFIKKARASIITSLAEASLANLAHAMPGVSVSGSTLTIGSVAGDVLDKLALELIGVAPSGNARTLTCHLATAVGATAPAHLKGDIMAFDVQWDLLFDGVNAVALWVDTP